MLVQISDEYIRKMLMKNWKAGMNRVGWIHCCDSVRCVLHGSVEDSVCDVIKR